MSPLASVAWGQIQRRKVNVCTCAYLGPGEGQGSLTPEGRACRGQGPGEALGCGLSPHNTVYLKPNSLVET